MPRRILRAFVVLGMRENFEASMRENFEAKEMMGYKVHDLCAFWDVLPPDLVRVLMQKWFVKGRLVTEK